MKMIAVDTRSDRLKELVVCLQTAFPLAEITAFADPSLAVQYSFKHHVDLVFTEYSMRRLDGIQVAEGIHFFRPKAMIYLITDVPAQIRKTRHGDITGCLMRPLSAEDIRMRVKEDCETWERAWQAKNAFVPSHSKAGRSEI